MPDGERVLTDEEYAELARQILEAYLARPPDSGTKITQPPIDTTKLTQPWWDIKGKLHNPTAESRPGSEWWRTPGASGPAEETFPGAPEDEPPEVDWTVYEGQLPDFIIEMAKGMFALRDMYGPVYRAPAEAINSAITLVLNTRQLTGE